MGLVQLQAIRLSCQLHRNRRRQRHHVDNPTNRQSSGYRCSRRCFTPRLISSVTNSLNNIPTITDELKAKITSTMSNGGFSGGMNLNGIPEEYSTDIMQMFYSGFANSLNTAMKVAVLFCIIGVLVSFLLPNKKKAPRN